MNLATNGVTMIAIGAVAAVLLLGLLNMMRGGPANKSQMFMRWRVGLQFVAVVILMMTLYLTGR